MSIGHRIKERRKLLKMSADELGRRLGKDRSTIYRYEKGDIENLPLDILEPIAKVLDTTPAHLMGWDTEEQKRMEEKNDALADIVIRLRTDEVFLSVVEELYKRDAEKLSGLLALLK